MNFRFQTYDSHSGLGAALRLIRGPYRPRDGFFLRAESFYNVATYIEELDKQPVPPLKAAYGGSLHERFARGGLFSRSCATGSPAMASTCSTSRKPPCPPRGRWPCSRASTDLGGP